MLIGVDPALVTLGPLAVRWYGVLALLGLALGVWLTVRAAGVPRELVLEAVAWAIPVGVLSARLAHVLGDWDYYLTRPGEVWRLPLGELSLWGGIVGGGLVAAAALRRHRVDPGRVADAAVPGLALGIALGQVGTFLDGSGQGVPTSLPWGTQYASRLAATPDFGVPRHPAQLYDGLVALGLLALVSAGPRWRRPLPPGVRCCAFLALYAAARVAFGGVRLDPPFLFGLQADQLIAGCVALFALARGSLALGRAARRPAPSRPGDRAA